MDDAGIDACPLMGWSMGVNTAFELAYLHPHRVTGLFAVAGVPGGTFASMLAPLGVPRLVRAAITVNAARVMGVLGRPASIVARRLPVGPLTGAAISHSGFMLPVPDVAMARRAIKEFLTTPIEWYMHLAVTTSRHVRVSLRGIDVPASFVAGRWDVLASAEDMRTAAERIAGATYVRLNSSHFVAMERPDEVHDLLLELLDRVSER
jgi:pimeloyl-ACP methyl ester carboxylesterase